MGIAMDSKAMRQHYRRRRVRGGRLRRAQVDCVPGRSADRIRPESSRESRTMSLRSSVRSSAALRTRASQHDDSARSLENSGTR